MLKAKILEQTNLLIESGEILRRGDSSWHTLNLEHEQKCHWFLWRVNSFISQYLKASNWYYLSITKIINQWHGFTIPQTTGSLVESLKCLKIDIENWFLKWFESQISAEIFDNFLDHWEQYLNKSMKNEAGVIIGITFEDIIRKLGRLNNIEEKKLEDVINKLQFNNIITSIETKRAKSCSWLRTSAAHARWEEFTKNDVEACFKFTKELISKMDDLQ